MRTIADIKYEMTSAFMADPVIKAKYDPTNTWTNQTTFESVFSLVSLENILFYIVAVVNFGVEFLFGKHKEEVEALEAEMRIGSKQWWRNLAFSFQYGYNLIYNDLTYAFEYQTIDATAQIIKYVEVRELPQGGLYMLVAIADGNDEPIKLTDANVIAGFTTYMKLVKVAGIPFIWETYDADLVWVYLKVRYNPLIINAAGENILTGLKPVEIALKDYLKGIPYGHGRLNKTYLIDAVQKAEGVVDIFPNTAYADWLLTQGETQLTQVAVVQEVLAVGGSFKFDGAGINIIYEANV